MPVNMTMQQPGPRIVCHKPERNVVSAPADVDDVAAWRIDVVVCRTPRGAHNVEGMAMYVKWVLRSET